MSAIPRANGDSPPRRKVFLLGLPKTGTTTLHTTLIRWGYRPLRGAAGLLDSYRKGDLATILASTETADCFRALPWQFMHAELFDYFGDAAQFVLTTRITPEKWIDSLKAHAFRYEDASLRIFQFGSEFPHGREAEHIAIYNAHNAAVRDFFAKADAQHLLLDVCWEAGQGWPEVCRFLSRPIPDEPFPNLNGRESFPYDPAIVAKNQQRIDDQVRRLAAVDAAAPSVKLP
jgi:hypothetical protein